MIALFQVSEASQMLSDLKILQSHLCLRVPFNKLQAFAYKTVSTSDGYYLTY